jgi:diketogulonate reductase-like aldo/keto reductase
VGAAVSACLNEGLRREELYLQTKFTPLAGQDPEQIPYDSQARLAEQVAQSFQTSTRNLRTSQVDCLVLHSPLSDDKQMREVWQAMELIFDGGGARQLGISNCYSLEYLESLCRSARVPPAVVQNRFYSETDYDRDIRAFCRQQRIIYQSFWTLTANPHILGHENVKALALARGRTPAQILFRCLTQQDVVPLTGTKTEAHLCEDLAIFDFELRPEELDVVSALF